MGPTFAALILADREDKERAPRLVELLNALNSPLVPHHIVVEHGAHGPLLDTALAPFAQIVESEKAGIVPALRTGLQALPVVDAVMVYDESGNY